MSQTIKEQMKETLERFPEIVDSMELHSDKRFRCSCCDRLRVKTMTIRLKNGFIEGVCRQCLWGYWNKWIGHKG